MVNRTWLWMTHGRNLEDVRSFDVGGGDADGCGLRWRGVQPAPASAACAQRWLGAGTDLAVSEDERINSGCDSDLRVRRGGTTQRYRGRYWTGSLWAIGLVGWVTRSYSSTNWYVFLDNVVVGTHIRVQAESSNATAESHF